MSGKLQVKPLLAKHHLTSEHPLIANINHTYNSYEQELETNLRIILKRFNNLDNSKVRSLLEELDNNLELAIQILEEQMKASNLILEEKKLENNKKLNLTRDQENQILKQSFLNLYKKYASLQKNLEDERKKSECLRQQVQKLKCMNKILMEGEFSQLPIQQSRDIY